MSSPLRLTGTRVAEYFRFGCERQLRYELVPPALRGGEVPRANADPAAGPLVGPRPGSGLLAGAGRAWERGRLRRLVRKLGAERVRSAGWTLGDNPRRLPYEEVVATLRDPGAVEVLVQPELRLDDPSAFLARFGLDAELTLAPAVPDVVRVRRLHGGRVLFQVVDIKASAEARLSHYAQVAYYTLVLEEVCRAEGIAGEVDVRWGRVWSRNGRGPERFPLAAYRHHVAEVLRHDLPRVVRSAPSACGWHLGPRCGGCAFLEHCRAQADAADDLCRVPGMSPTARGLLRARGVRSVRQLARSFGRDTYRGCHALESQAERLKQRAQALSFGKVFDVERSTHLMPRSEDVRVILAAEGDPVTGHCYAVGARAVATVPLPGVDAVCVRVAVRPGPEGERALLEALVGWVDDVARAATDGRARPATVHFYVYDRVELDLLRRMALRHLTRGGAGAGVAGLLRFLSPRTLSARADVVRSAPGSVVADVVAALFALPVPYAYDLPAVSLRLAPAGEPVAFAPPSGYGVAFSSQIAFERIHDAWRGRGYGEASAGAVLAEIHRLVEQKLAAIDSVVRAIRERAARRERLQLRKEPLRLPEPGRPLADPELETLRLFAELESATAAVALQALHVLPAAERARRFECIRGLHLVERRADGMLVFEFDEACRDAKFRVGDFDLLLTNDDDRSLVEVARAPWKRRHLGVELVDFDLAARPPRVVLAPSGDLSRAEAERWIDLDRVCVLDRTGTDYGTRRIVATLEALAAGAGEAATVLALLRGEAPAGWASPWCIEPVERELLAAASAAYGRPVLNRDQRRAWRATLARPISVVWGPPGTGKTYLLAWTLLGLADAARRAGRPLRVLVTAATHRAVTNVLARLAAERAATGVTVPLRAVKLRGSGNVADADLEGTSVEVVDDARLPALLREAEEGATPLVAGGTVWSLWKQMRAVSARGAGTDGGEEDGGPAPVAPLFDVVVVDEASQMKVAESLIALSSLRAGGQVVLCGDDRQLAPVVSGRYGDDVGTLFGSAFEHFAARFPRLALRESRRMNGALVEYPRELFYPGLVSMVPGHRIALAPAPPDEADAGLREAFLDPDDAVVLCTYAGVRATARNAFEAGLVARLVALARRALLDPATGAPYEDARFVAEALAVLSPHRAQNSAILAELARLGVAPEETPVVDTVERMQGNEREVVVVSYGVADREYAEAEAAFLLDPNRFNVATTRARAKLIVLLSDEVLAAVPADGTVLSGSMALKGYPGHCRDGERIVELPGPDGAPVSLRLRYRRLGSTARPLETPAPPLAAPPPPAAP